MEADSGAMGGSGSQEFMVYTEAGEDLIASSASGYAANLEKATSKLTPVDDLAPTGDGAPELVHTPGKASIADVTEFFGIQARRISSASPSWDSHPKPNLCLVRLSPSFAAIT